MNKPRYFYKDFWRGLWKYCFRYDVFVIFKPHNNTWKGMFCQISEKDKLELIKEVFAYYYYQEDTLDKAKQILEQERNNDK